MYQQDSVSRVFAYCRMSTADQTPDNQIREIEAVGFSLTPPRIVTEHISGSVTAMERPKFKGLSERLERGDALVVTKLDRLGRNVMDVRSTVEALAAEGVRVHCLALDSVDLTSAAGRMTMQVLEAVAEFEQELLIERTNAGIKRAKADGKTLGRRPALTPEQQQQVHQKLTEGTPVAQLARDYKTTRQTIMRVRERLEVAH